MYYLTLALYTYLIIGAFNLMMTIIVVLRNEEHKNYLTSRLKTIWSFPRIGKVFAIITVILSFVWVLIGWPAGLRSGFKRLKKSKNEIQH